MPRHRCLNGPGLVQDLHLHPQWEMPHRSPHPCHLVWILECDSCLTGGGACSPTRYYSEEYSDDLKRRFLCIHELEAVSLSQYNTSSWSHPQDTSGINTDHHASDLAVESSRSRDPTLALCTRELWLLAISRSFNIAVRHKPGTSLVLADALRQVHSSTAAARAIKLETEARNITTIQVSHDSFPYPKLV